MRIDPVNENPVSILLYIKVLNKKWKNVYDNVILSFFFNSQVMNIHVLLLSLITIISITNSLRMDVSDRMLRCVRQPVKNPCSRRGVRR